jgi:large subunit ribosomal protein L19e
MSSIQKRLAAKVLKVGESRVWLDPTKIKDIEKAITKADIRKLILQGAIKALPEKIKKREKKEKARKGPGRRKGGKYSILSRKTRWILTVRSLRKMLKELREAGKIDKSTYRKVYKLIKGGMFRSRAHLKLYLEQYGLLEEK